MLREPPQVFANPQPVHARVPATDVVHRQLLTRREQLVVRRGHLGFVDPQDPRDHALRNPAEIGAAAVIVNADRRFMGNPRSKSPGPRTAAASAPAVSTVAAPAAGPPRPTAAVARRRPAAA